MGSEKNSFVLFKGRYLDFFLGIQRGTLLRKRIQKKVTKFWRGWLNFSTTFHHPIKNFPWFFNPRPKPFYISRQDFLTLFCTLGAPLKKNTFLIKIRLYFTFLKKHYKNFVEDKWVIWKIGRWLYFSPTNFNPDFFSPIRYSFRGFGVVW